MEIKIKNKNFEFDVKKESEKYKLLNLLMLSKIKEMPILINGLLYLSDINDVEESEKEQIAYTYQDFRDNRIKISINWEKIESLNMTSDEILFLIFHEYLHNFFYHFKIMKNQFEEDQELTNICCDYFINALLSESFGYNIINNFKNKYQFKLVDYEFIESLVEIPLYFNNYHEAISERNLYDFLKKNRIKTSTNSTYSDHKKLFEKSKDAIKQLNKEREQKGLGQLTENEFQQLFESELNNKIDNLTKGYSEGNDQNIIRYLEDKIKKNNLLNTIKFRRMLNNKLIAKYQKSYSRLNRKKQDENFIFKGRTKKQGEKIVIAIDVSGSISDKELKEFYEIMNGYLKKDHLNMIDVIYWSSCEITENNFHQNITDIKDIINLKPYSSGGTDIDYLDQFLEKNYNYPVVLFNLTDGFFKYKKIPDSISEYFFILTEKNYKNDIEEYYKYEKRIKVFDIRG